MKQVTLLADTPQEAYRQALARYGKEARIVSARQVRREGRLMAEVTLELDEAAILQAEVAALQEQIASMRAALIAPKTPRSIETVSKLLIQAGIAPAWLKRQIEDLDRATLGDQEALLSTLLRSIDEAIITIPEPDTPPATVILVGPTGVGKSTTMAKLAARWRYVREQKVRVGMVSVDDFKVGAREQLAHYAEVMALPYLSLDLRTSDTRPLAKLSQEVDTVLIDTAGMSPYDTQRFIETIDFLTRHTPQRSIYLVLPATIKYEDMADVYASFAFLNLAGVIVTKFDETRHLGSLLNLSLEHRVGFAYFSDGQRVPEDLHVASTSYLLHRFLGEVEACRGGEDG